MTANIDAPAERSPAAKSADLRDLTTGLFGMSLKPTPLDNLGWLRGPDRRLMLWVPRDYRENFRNLARTHVSGGPGVSSDLNQSVHGTEWVECYAPRTGQFP